MPRPEELTFTSGGQRCAAWRLRGEGDALATAAGRPCVVLAHGFAGTRDSGLLPYAERFAAAGLDALVFDYRHFGDSEGEPRQLVSIPRQLEDYAAAVACARGLDGVDPARVVVWGTSYSGGHVFEVAARDGRVAAAVAQTPATDGVATLRTALRFAGPRLFARATVAGLRDAARGLAGRPPLTIPVVGPPGTLGTMTTPDAQPGMSTIAGPAWRNEVCARIVLRAGSYRPGKRAGDLPCPILVQLADRDAVAPPDAARAAAWEAKGRAEVRTYPVGHFEMYTGEPFERAVADQLHFLRRHLGARAEHGAAAI